jgi:hypothetical protein
VAKIQEVKVKIFLFFFIFYVMIWIVFKCKIKKKLGVSAASAPPGGPCSKMYLNSLLFKILEFDGIFLSLGHE